ncbi:apolipoprotein N-acyltransferase [Fodinicurvata sp. EGI_FJ10296]|uniref:apolipoprotein N-acyltransferase n=1 Tax=Fodinicurvata sp. EGI_FJ10296 TaxID=3231908 RepID=UPI003453B95A
MRLETVPRWRRLGLALFLGALVALALPPFFAVPVLLVLIPGLLALIDAANGRWEIFFTGWVFGFGMFVSGLYWIAWALTVDLAAFWWLIPFAIAGLPAFLAILTGLVALAWRRLPLADPTARAVAFAVIFSAAEALRGVMLTGFPWNLLGYGWTGWLPVLQSVSVIGIHGLSFLTILVAALPYGLLLGPRRSAASRQSGWATAAGIALFALIAIGGWARLAAVQDSPAVADVTLRLVQPNVAQESKWDADQWPAIFDRLLTMSREDATDITHVIWPETAIPYFLTQDGGARSMIAESVPPEGLILTGAPRLQGDWSDPGRRIYNSLSAVNGSGDVVATYDKVHLVPFGEYVPLRSLLPIDKITPGRIDFSPGPGLRTLHLDGLPPVGPLICYEVIFPGRVIGSDDRPEWLLNVTNDAWYGHTSGPYQHFAISRVRAAEEGMPVVRVANTGISGVVDSAGRVLSRLGLGQQGIIDTTLPGVWPSRTVFSVVGNWALFGLLLLGCAVAVAADRLRR